MATVTNSDIQVLPATIKVLSPWAEAAGREQQHSPKLAANSPEITIHQYQPAFAAIVGDAPTFSLLLTSAGSTNNPFFHEACVFLPDHDELYITSNLLQNARGSSSVLPTILISRVRLHRGGAAQTRSGSRGRIESGSGSGSGTRDSSRSGSESRDASGQSGKGASEDGIANVTRVDWVKMRPPPGIDMPNGAVNHPSGDGIIICAQGNLTPGTGGIFHMPRHTPPRPIITNVGGRELNAPNDVVVARDGAVWFTDPCYGADQDFRRRPQLPNAVWRFDEKTGDVRMVADGLGRPNGIAFSPDESVCYITDTDTARGAPPNDPTRASTIYAYDVVNYHGSPFLANKRVFAFVSNGFPDGIKCDLDGNVYSGVGDGVAVWSPAGVRLGTIATGSWVANFSFGRKGEMFICNETRLWRVQLGGELRGALLGV